MSKKDAWMKAVEKSLLFEHNLGVNLILAFHCSPPELFHSVSCV